MIKMNRAELKAVLDEIGASEDGWRSNRFGDGLVCPCGNNIELDGECYCGKKSPLRNAGLI